MIKFLRNLWNDRRGNALMIAGAMLPLLVGAAGLATDTIEWTLWKRQLQRAADSAAIAGVYDREAASGATTNTEAAVNHDLSLNLHTWMDLVSGYPDVDYPADTASVTNHVSVTLAVRQQLPFSSFFLSTAPLITASATAASISSGGTACVEALETNASLTGITNSGNTSINMPNCVMYSNSPSSNSASAGGSSSVIARAIAAVGGIQQSNNWHVGSYMPYSPQLPDPFANVTPNPADIHCAGHYVTGHGANATTTWVYDSLTSSTDMANAHWLDSSGVEHTSGANCWSSLSVGSNTTLNVPNNFGPLYINGGNADLQGTFNCTGCSVVLTNTSTSPTATIGTFSSNAQAHNNIDAVDSGTFAGIAVYQDRRATGNTDHINGGSGSVVNGAVYFPKDILWINGNGTASALCAMFVARRIVFTGTSGIALRGLDDAACSGASLPSVTPVKMVRLVA